MYIFNWKKYGASNPVINPDLEALDGHEIVFEEDRVRSYFSWHGKMVCIMQDWCDNTEQDKPLEITCGTGDLHATIREINGVTSNVFYVSKTSKIQPIGTVTVRNFSEKTKGEKPLFQITFNEAESVDVWITQLQKIAASLRAQAQPTPAQPAQYREVQRKANVGDLIKHKDGWTSKAVSKCYLFGLEDKCVICEDGHHAADPNNYVVLDPLPWQPKPGDLVEITETPNKDRFSNGDIVKIDHICTMFQFPHITSKDGYTFCLSPAPTAPCERKTGRRRSGSGQSFLKTLRQSSSRRVKSSALLCSTIPVMGYMSICPTVKSTMIARKTVRCT